MFSWQDGTPWDYTNWNGQHEPVLRADFGCVAESQGGNWWTTNCDREYDWVVCSYQPCNQGFAWVHGRCLLFIGDEEEKTFDEASAYCESLGVGATIVIEDNQAITDWVTRYPTKGEHWIGIKLVNFHFFNILHPVGQFWCTLLDRQFSNELSKLVSRPPQWRSRLSCC